MGLFDYVKCRYPLPIEGANALEFQTKDTGNPFMENYEIRADGSLWREHYDTEDRSDPTAEGLRAFAGCMTRVNRRWEPEPLTGSLEFHTMTTDRRWLSFDALFKAGKLQTLVDKSKAEGTP